MIRFPTSIVGGVLLLMVMLTATVLYMRSGTEPDSGIGIRKYDRVLGHGHSHGQGQGHGGGEGDELLNVNVKIAQLQRRVEAMEQKQSAYAPPAQQDPEVPKGQVVPQESRDVHGQGHMHPALKVVPSTLPDKAGIPRQDCVPLPATPKAGVILCIYSTKEDKWVSGTIRAGHLWEGDLLHPMVSYIKTDPEIQLLDIGANVGQWTVFFAALGRDVLSVEMLPANIHLIQKSLTLNEGQGPKVTLVQNGLWSGYKTLQANVFDANVGGSFIKEAGAFDAKKINISTVCMDDLIPLLKSRKVIIKMDIENSEDDALMCADKFFAQVDVKVLLMEWSGKKPEEARTIIEFTKKHGLQASKSPLSNIPVTLSEKWRGNVYFTKF